MVQRFILILSMLFFCGIFIATPAPAQEIVWDGPPKNVAHINIFKSKRLMQLLDAHGNIVATYKIALGKSPIGSKEREGDGRTPEGRYKIDFRNSESRFYRSLRITYPNQSDKARARQNGQLPGGNIFIHGEPNKRDAGYVYTKDVDWTDGCIAVSNKEMDDLWASVDEGTTILIRP